MISAQLCRDIISGKVSDEAYCTLLNFQSELAEAMATEPPANPFRFSGGIVG